MKQWLEKIRSFEWKDPMVIILVCLLVFLVTGTSIKGCLQMTAERKTVCIDGAFGGSFKGYEGIVNEAEVTGKLVDELAALLEKDRDFIVIRTDRSKTVSERVEMIRNTDASLVLSIHADGSLDPSASGMRNSVMKTRDVHRDDSIRFAQCIANAFSGSLDVHNGTMLYKPLEGGVVSRKDTDLTDTTVYTYDTWSIMDCEKVTVVSDLCYVTCQKDVDTWCHEEGYRKAAGLYYRAIRNYYGLQ